VLERRDVAREQQHVAWIDSRQKTVEVGVTANKHGGRLHARATT
jgi:hypothetical protein